MDRFQLRGCGLEESPPEHPVISGGLVDSFSYVFLLSQMAAAGTPPRKKPAAAPAGPATRNPATAPMTAAAVIALSQLALGLLLAHDPPHLHDEPQLQALFVS